MNQKTEEQHELELIEIYFSETIQNQYDLDFTYERQYEANFYFKNSSKR